jgi:SAM-dependent methyltransferase
MNKHTQNLIDFETLLIKPENLSDKQKQYLHLIDPRFFAEGTNPYREEQSSFEYETPVDLDEELFYLHPLMDVSVLEQGAVRRFPSGVNEKYISEKFFEDRWVSEGNNELANRLEQYLNENLERLQQQDVIRLIDIGPCGGAITTLFALRALDRVGLLEKTQVAMLDIVPNVLEATKAGQFIVPNEMIQEYDLVFAGGDGEKYKTLLADEKTTYYLGDGEKLPDEVIGQFDIVLSAYTHHHMNLHGRKLLCEQMEEAAREGGFIGVADFYVLSYEDYMKWYKPHFEQYGDAPPVECPIVDGKTLANWLKNTQGISVDERLERTFVLSGTKE